MSKTGDALLKLAQQNPDIAIRLLAMGHKVPGVYAEPVLTGEDAKMFAFMQTVRQNMGKWEKKRMLAKGHYHK